MEKNEIKNDQKKKNSEPPPKKTQPLVTKISESKKVPKISEAYVERSSRGRGGTTYRGG